jgi:hypothetical protein
VGWGDLIGGNGLFYAYLKVGESIQVSPFFMNRIASIIAELYCYLYYLLINYIVKRGRTFGARQPHHSRRISRWQAGAFAMLLLWGWVFIFFGTFEIVSGNDVLWRIPLPALLIPSFIGVALLDHWIFSSHYERFEKEFTHWPRSKRTTWAVYVSVVCLGSVALFAYIGSICHDMNKGKTFPQAPHGLTRVSDVIVWSTIAAIGYVVILRLIKSMNRKDD